VTVTAKPATGIGEKADEIYNDFDEEGKMEIRAFTASAGAKGKAQKTAACTHVS
jgi:hypothetical protein